MATWYFHYTSHGKTQAIKRAGMIRAGIGGIVYLTPDLYDLGYVAADRLSTRPDVPRQMVTAVTEVDVEAVVGDHESTMVEPLFISGLPVSSGGGLEVEVAGDLPISSTTLFLRLRDP